MDFDLDTPISKNTYRYAWQGRGSCGRLWLC